MKFLRSACDCGEISILKIKDVHDVYRTVKKEFNSYTDLELPSDSAVVIKPNLCAIKTPETGATTDARFVEGIVNYLKSEFDVSDISIVESDGTQVLADMAFKLLGYERLSRNLGVKLVNLSKSPFSVKEFPTNVYLKKIRVPKVIKDANFFISIPKIKTHSDCTFTSALKNQYGCNPFPHKAIYHKRLHDAIVDLNFAFKPDLVVVDGIVAMEGIKGPTNGTPIRTNTIIAGRDPVGVDYLVARMMGINPDHVGYLVEARKRGLGKTTNKIRGASLKEVRKKFSSSRPRLRNLYGLFRRDL